LTAWLLLPFSPGRRGWGMRLPEKGWGMRLPEKGWGTRFGG
jgi:hypothetical protein